MGGRGRWTDRGGALEPAQRELHVLRIEPVDIVLERIRNEAPLDPHPRLALVPEPLVAQGGLEDVIVVRVVAELHVAPEVPREALFVHDARREPARGRGRLEEAEVVEAELLEPMSGAKPCRPTPAASGCSARFGSNDPLEPGPPPWGGGLKCP